MARQKSQQTPQQAPVIAAPPTMAELEARCDNLQGQLQKVEKQVCDLESKYVRSASPLGTAVTGYEGFLTGLAVAKQDMRIFSKSSVTAPQILETTSTGTANTKSTDEQKVGAVVKPELIDKVEGTPDKRLGTMTASSAVTPAVSAADVAISAAPPPTCSQNAASAATSCGL